MPPGMDPNAGPEGADPSLPPMTPENIQELIRQFGDSANKSQTQILQSRAEMEGMGIDAKRKAMELLQSAGVNLSDPESFNNYIAQVEEADPDAAEMMKTALDSIFSDGQAQ